MIRKTRSGYRIVSHKTGRNMGTYKSRKQAVKRLRQIKHYSKR
jgi:hypothetical protein